MTITGDLRHRRALFVALTLLLALLAPTPPTTAASRSTTIDLATLPTGKPLRIPSLVYSSIGPTEQLVRPGKKPVTLTTPGGSYFGGRAMDVRGGYLVDVYYPDHQVLVFYSRNGKVRREIAHTTSAYGNNVSPEDASVSADGRVVAIDPQGNFPDVSGHSITVLRARDGRVLAQRSLADYRLVGLGRHTAYLLRRADATTWRWSLGNNKLKLLHRGVLDTGNSYGWPAPINVSAGQAVYPEGDHQLVRPLVGRKPRWRTRANEYVRSWSPDDRLVITSRALPAGEYLFRVRGARTGKLRLSIRGKYLDEDGYRLQSPIWESPDVVLLYAYEGYTESYPLPAGGLTPEPYGGALVRCRISTGECKSVSGQGDPIFPRLR